MDYMYCILPSGNAPEFPMLDAELVARRVHAWYRTMRGGGRIYRIDACDIPKLPYDAQAQEHYLGDDKSGHRIYQLSDVDDAFEFDAPWTEVKGSDK